MEHLEYKSLTALLESIIAGTNLLNWANNEGRHYFDDRDPRGIYLYPGFVDFLERWGSSDIPFDLLQQTNSFDNEDVNTLQIIPRLEYAYRTMCSCENGYYKENQERADNNLGPTQDFVSLYRTISRYLSGDGINDRWDEIVRGKLQEWTDQANGWFPDLNDIIVDQESANQVKSSTHTVTIDRDKLAGLFIGSFKVPRPRPGEEPLPPGFDMFYNAFASNANQFTPTDIGRIAYQVQHSKFVLPRLRKIPFSKFARLFFEYCGATVPKDLSPRTYKSPTQSTEYKHWLE